MENASKALLIAGAIIIVIMIISFGMYIWSKAQDAADLEGMDRATVEAFNSNLQKYQGTKKGSEVIAMINAINSLNTDENSENNVTINNEAAPADVTATGSQVTSIKTGTEKDGKIDAVNTGSIKQMKHIIFILVRKLVNLGYLKHIYINNN